MLPEDYIAGEIGCICGVQLSWAEVRSSCLAEHIICDGMQPFDDTCCR